MDEQIRKELDAQAERVAEWLICRLRWREWWLESELYIAAERDGIDLRSWKRHPRVLSVLDENGYFGPGFRDGVTVCRLAAWAALAAEERHRIVQVCEEPPALAYDVVDPETVAS